MTPDYTDIRAEVAKLCAGFPGEYWRAKDRERAYPTEFVQALGDAGYLAALIPEDLAGPVCLCQRRQQSLKRCRRRAATAGPAMRKCM